MEQPFRASASTHATPTAPGFAASRRTPGADALDTDTIHLFADGTDDTLARALREYGCNVFTHGLDADAAALGDMTHGAVVIDVFQLSKCFNICRQLRTRGFDFPLVTMTASTDPFDEVLALELGVDEVIGRQVHPRVLLARLRAILRRSVSVRAPVPTTRMRFGELHVDGENRNVTLRGARVETTSGEFDLLWLLVQNAGHVIRRDEVLTKLRGLTGSHTSRSVDARLYRLRQRFVGVADIATRIKSVRPYGYMFVNAPW